MTADQIREVGAATFRKDNRVVLTYVPAERPADSAAEPADETTAGADDTSEEVAA